MKAYFCWACLLLTLCLVGMNRAMAAPQSAAGPEIVVIDSGQVQGTVSADSKVRMFRGIPFAAPPVGPLRWKAPIRLRSGTVCARPLSLDRAACKLASMGT